jgi:tetratricopeptide (TPR) repeat protein
MEANEFFEEAKRLFIQGKLRESIEVFTKAADSGYDPVISRLSRGAAYLKLKEADRAIGDFSSVITMDRETPRAYYYRGMAYAQKEDYEKAVADFTRAIELKPDDGAALFARGASYMAMGKMEEAGDDIKHAANHLAAAVQGYADTIGDRTHLHRVLAVLEGERREEAFDLNEAEFGTIKAMLEESVGAGT